MKKTVSIMIPCYNEEENIVAITDAVVKQMEALPQYDYEIVCIDNCSTDNTRPLLREICAKNPKIKAIFNVNEVITSIMMNWIGMNLTNFIVNNRTQMLAAAWGASSKDRTAALGTANPGAVIPKLGLNELFNYSTLNAGLIIAVVVAVIIWVVLSKTTFGYELRACGLNKNGSIYAGINAKRNIVLSMVIAGALAGLGGGLYFLAGGPQYTMVQTILPTGFDGISVALLANSNPIGCIFSAIFIAFLRLGGIAMQSQGYATEATDIVMAVIIYLAAVSLLIRLKLGSLLNHNREVAKK